MRGFLLLFLYLGAFLFSTLLFLGSANGQTGRRIGSVDYFHSSVGTTAQDAIPAGNVERNVKGWRICHDAGSTANYLAISTGADPATDGIYIAANTCYECDECGGTALKDVNVKADAAATGYSVIQFN